LDTEKILDVKVNLPKSSIDKVMQEVEQQTGIQIVDYRLDFFGYQKS
jgi:Fur family ferric uptake transcriptional regulator